jgi:spore coat protein SA
MRICHVAPELLPVPPTRGGAIERWIRDAAARLARRGHEVHVVSRDAGDEQAAERTIDGVHYHYVRIPRALDTGRRAALGRGAWYHTHVRALLPQIAPDIVHHHSRPAGLWLARSPRLTARLVISLHSMEYGWGFLFRAWDRPLFARGFAAAARVLGVSDYISRHAVERFPGIAGKTSTVYNGVDGELFCPPAFAKAAAGRQELKTPRLRQGCGAQARPQDLTVLYVGRIEARKGVDVLVSAFEQIVAPCVPSARLRLVGPHSYWDARPSPYYVALQARCQANPRIEFAGPTYVDAELADVYRQADVSVVPSVFPEALGLTSIEAQSSGVPVVVSDAGGLPETVSPGQTGVVVPANDARALGQALVSLLEDEPRRRSMAARAREWAMSRFSWDAIAAELEQLYGELTCRFPAP